MSTSNTPGRCVLVVCSKCVLDQNRTQNCGHANFLGHVGWVDMVSNILVQHCFKFSMDCCASFDGVFQKCLVEAEVKSPVLVARDRVTLHPQMSFENTSCTSCIACMSRGGEVTAGLGVRTIVIFIVVADASIAYIISQRTPLRSTIHGSLWIEAMKVPEDDSLSYYYYCSMRITRNRPRSSSTVFSKQIQIMEAGVTGQQVLRSQFLDPIPPS